ncbi:MAG: hypothetical protein L6Q97_08735, partial [Thermoanaerobaculia bacterium]|nr:hypothetical protein [Thermoanaerobaculia bacterium]
MHRTKLIEALRALHTRERTRWRQYVHAGFFNKHEDLRRLADYVLSFAPAFASEHLDKRVVWQHVFGPESPCQELKLNNLISDLYELLLGYLAYTGYETNLPEQQLLAANALLDRNLSAQAGHVLERARTLLDRQPAQTARRQFLEIRWWESAEILDSRQSRRIAGQHLLCQAEANDLAFVLEKLRLGAAMLNRHGLAVLQAEERPRWLPAIRQWCAEEPLLSEHPAVRVYLAALELLENPAPDHFSALNALLDQHHAVFGPEELAALYQYALNYCIRRINDGHPEAYREALDLYRTLLDRNVLLRQGRLSQWTYKNITTAGLRSGAFAWTEQFLHQYRDALPPAEQENAFAYNMAALNFEKQNFPATLLTLQNVEFTDFTYHLGAKILQLKCYYLLDETEALTALLEATRQLLRRNRSLSPFGKTANLHFL